MVNNSKSYKFLITICTILSLKPTYGSELFKSDLFSYDNLVEAKGLNARINGQDWHAENVKNDHTDFYCQLFANPNTMQQFGSGQIVEYEVTRKRVDMSINDRFAQGHPNGFMTGLNCESQPFMTAIARGGDKPGTSEIAFIIQETYQNKKFAKSAGQALIETWAPEVRRIGRGEGFDNIKYAAIMKKFCCFGDRALDQLDATASPGNVASWKILTGLNFRPADQDLANHSHDISYDGVKFDSRNPYQCMENDLSKLYDAHETDEPLTSGQCYSMIDIDGQPRTFSKHNHYNRIKYHFSKKIE